MQFYTPHDRSLADAQSALGFVFADGTSIEFQFPPKVPDNSRGGVWDENAATGPNAGDVIATYKNSEPRKITLRWTYILTGGMWTAARIEKQLSRLRRYFVNSSPKAPFDQLAIFLKLWKFGGQTPMSFRMTNASVKHGDTMIGAGADAFALRTDVTVELKSWPKVLEAEIAQGQLETPPEWY